MCLSFVLCYPIAELVSFELRSNPLPDSWVIRFAWMWTTFSSLSSFPSTRKNLQPLTMDSLFSKKSLLTMMLKTTVASAARPFSVRLPRMKTDVPATHRGVALGRSGGQSGRTIHIWDTLLFRRSSHGDLISPNCAHTHIWRTCGHFPNISSRSSLVYMDSSEV
jgi:hypothetical protein